MDSIREKAIQAFADRISAGRCLQLDGNSELPARAVWDTTESAEATSYGKREVTVDLNVGFMAQADWQALSKQGNAMLAELIDDAMSQDPTLGGLCKRINYSDSVIDYPEPGQNEIAVLAVFELVYETDNASPYNP